jgi:uncharacterized protein involved in tolerance to divalent cations
MMSVYDETKSGGSCIKAIIMTSHTLYRYEWKNEINKEKYILQKKTDPSKVGAIVQLLCPSNEDFCVQSVLALNLLAGSRKWTIAIYFVIFI